MAEAVIRFEQEQQEWAAWEARAKSKFGEQVAKSKPFLKDRLAHLEGMEIKYRMDANRAEKRELNILRGQRREIEKLLYPGLLSRLSYLLLQLFVTSKMQKKQQIIKVTNIDALTTSLSQKGFSRIGDQLHTQVNAGLSEFKIPVSYQVDESSGMNYNLHFQKDFDGSYQLKEIRATLKDHVDGKGSSMLFSSIPAEHLTAKQAYNLLSGRAVEHQGQWYTLDINDRDAQGNLRTKVFPSEYGFSIEKLLEVSGIKGINDPAVRASILEGLRNGDSLTVMSGRKNIEIEANPHHNSLEKPSVIMERREAEKNASRTVKLEKEVVAKVSKVKISTG